MLSAAAASGVRPSSRIDNEAPRMPTCVSNCEESVRLQQASYPPNIPWRGRLSHRSICMLKTLYCVLALVALLALFATFSSAWKTGKILANGLSFAYVDEGSGPPIVLVHGSVSDYREWSNQIEPLARHYRVIAYSRRYHWPNIPPGVQADASVATQAGDLAAIIQTLGIAPVHLIGHSFGGAVALDVTLRHPALVRTLVLAEPAVSGVLANTPLDEAVSRESQAIRAKMKEVFATGDAERIVRTYTGHVAP